MAAISMDKADEMIRQIFDKHQPGQKRTFMLKQVLMAFGKSISNPKERTQKLNTLVLRHNLDQTDKIPLFRV